MCGITGVFGREDSVADVIASLEVMRKRGVDSLGLASEKDVFIAKNLTSLKKNKIDFSNGV
ncbi:MAG: hypothetical protein ACOCUR_01870, partial [Nanoarchaeota archaeon]